MPSEARLLGAFVLPLLVVLAATPLAIRVAERAGFYDRPAGYKGHGKATPYLGGAAVLGGFLLGAVSFGGGATSLAPVVACAFALWLLGTVDDRRTVGLWVRVAAEAGAATLLFAAGLGWSIFPSDAANYALTAVWVIGLVNAFNLMDNMDGATTTIAVLSALGAAVLAVALGDVTLGAFALALCGACVGFLPYNLARSGARIFLGDGGSMPIGFVVAASIMVLPLSQELGWHRLLAGMLLAGLPILDTSLVVVSRRRAGISILQGGRDHLTHRLRSRLPSARAVAAVLAAGQVLLCLAALGVTQLGDLSSVLAWCIVLASAAGAVLVLESEAWAPLRVQGPGDRVFLAASYERAPDEASLSAPQPSPAPPGDAFGRGSTATGYESAPDPLPPARPSPVPREGVGSLEGALLVLVALSLGLSPFLYGFYDLSVWGPIALGLLAVLFALVIARPALPRPAALASVVGLVALWGWSLLSMSWAESADQALTAANRWMLYAALLAILLLLLRNEALGKLLLATTTTLVVALGVYVLGVMVVGDGASLFIGPRLNEPLGYVNGQAAYFVLAFWPLVAVAERARRSLASGAAVGLATMLVGLVVLGQSRAVIVALLISAVALLLLVTGRRRRAWVLLAVGAGVALMAGQLLAVSEYRTGGAPAAHTLRAAGIQVVAVAAAAGAVWSALHGLRLVILQRGGRRAAAVLATASLGGLVVLAGTAAVLAATKVEDPAGTASRQLRAFTSLDPPGTSGSRLASSGGNRYDYWRIAVAQFRSEPLVGVGAGNYDRTYFLERRTTEDVRQPHSIELQVLSELGTVGGLALALFFGGVLFGFARRALAGRRSRTDAAMAVAAGGMFLTWLVHTSVDWLHLLPGVTGVALCGAAVLLAPWMHRRGALRLSRTRRMVVGAGAVLVVVAAAELGRSTLAERNLEQGRSALAAGDAPRALAESGDSLALNGESLPAYYLRASAFARLDEYQAARAALEEAGRLEPHDFVPPALQGDLAVRRRDFGQARRDYRRAAALNPRDPTLAGLAQDPRRALQ